MAPDPDPTIFVIDLQNTTKTTIKNSFSAYYFLKVHLHNFSKIKNSKRSHKTVGSRFFLLFLLEDKDQNPDPKLGTDPEHTYD